jgi:hypothetical protein
VPGRDNVLDILGRLDQSFNLGVYLHNPLSWNSWVNWGISPFVGGMGTSTYVVMTGDVLHTMPPFLGQGTNQALQE